RTPDLLRLKQQLSECVRSPARLLKEVKHRSPHIDGAPAKLCCGHDFDRVGAISVHPIKSTVANEVNQRAVGRIHGLAIILWPTREHYRPPTRICAPGYDVSIQWEPCP